MQVREAMTNTAEYIPHDMTIHAAARKMRELDTGFLPIGDSPDEKLRGVVTDRDIVLRATAENRDPKETTVDEVKTDRVLYCFENDDVESAARSMREQEVYRLVVLDGKESKRMTGVVTLNDISRQHEGKLAGDTAAGIAS